MSREASTMIGWDLLRETICASVGLIRSLRIGVDDIRLSRSYRSGVSRTLGRERWKSDVHGSAVLSGC